VLFRSLEYYEQVYSVGNISPGVGQVGVGLAFYFADRVQESLAWFENGLKSVEECGGIVKDRIMVMVAQVLYALGGESQVAMAKQQLLACISINKYNIRALLGLATFGLAQNDVGLAQAAASELVKVPPDVLIDSGLTEDFDLLLSRLFLLLGNTATSKHFLSKSIHRHPSKSQNYTRLARLLLQVQPESARMAFGLSRCAESLENTVSNSSSTAASVAEMWNVGGIGAIGVGGLLDDARTRISKAIRSMPTSVDAWFGMAIFVWSGIVHADRVGGDVSSMYAKLERIVKFVEGECITLATAAERLRDSLRVSKLMTLRSWTRLLGCEVQIYKAAVRSDASFAKGAVGIAEDVAATATDVRVRAACFVVIGRAYASVGERDTGIGFMRQAVGVLGCAWEELAQLYMSQKKHAAARACLVTSLTTMSGRKRIPALLRLSLIGLVEGDFAVVSESIGEALQLVDGDQELSNLCRGIQAVLLISTGKGEKGLKLIESVGGGRWWGDAIRKMVEGGSE